MIYPQNFEQKIGFDSIRHLLKGKCLVNLGEERVDEIFSEKYEEINEFTGTGNGIYSHYSRRKMNFLTNISLMYATVSETYPYTTMRTPLAVLAHPQRETP